MIYHLVRRIHSLKILVGIGTMILLLIVCGSMGLLARDPIGSVSVMVNVLLVAMFLWRFGGRCTIFEATLPIRPRDILSAQIVSAVFLILLPALVSAAFLAAGAGEDQHVAVIVLEIAAILMLWVITMNSIRLRRMSSPGLWREIALAAGATGAMVFVLIMRHRGVTAPVVFVGCAAGSAALLLRMWREAPETFEAADREAAAAKKTGRSLAPSFTSLPIVRALFPWRPALSICCVAPLMALTGNAFFGLIFLVVALRGCFPPPKWMWSLPIPRGKVFLSAVLSVIGPWFLAILVCLQIAREPARVSVVALATAALASLVLILWLEGVSVAIFGRRFYGLILVAPLAVPIFAAPMVTPERQLRFVERISGALPGNLGFVIVLCAAAVGALGWAACEVFCRMEPRRQDLPAKIQWQ